MSQVMIRQENFTIDYQAEVLPTLFKEQSSDCDFTLSDALQALDTDKFITIVKSARQTLLIACAELRCEELIQAVKQKADSGVRIYLLLGDTKGNQAAIDTLSGRCLIRTGVRQEGVLILVDHTTTQHQGLLLMGQDTLLEAGSWDWAISLEPQQIDDSFRSFCKLFWEESDDEYLQQNTVQEKTDHPDGNVITNHSHQLCGTLKDCLGETLNNLIGVSDFSIESENTSFRLLIGTDASNIKQLARHGVSLTDNRVPTLLLSESGCWLLPDSPDFDATNWCLKLSDEQSTEVAAAYDQAISDAAWQYGEKLTMSELTDKQQLRFSDESTDIQAFQKHRKYTLDAIYTDTIDSFLNDSADMLASNEIKWKRNFMAHKIDYKVEIHPPYYPPQANKDSLYGEWEGTEKNWHDQLELLEKKQSAIDKNQSDISDRLKGFIKGFLLGQGQSTKKFNLEFNALEDWSVTQATPAERLEYQKRLENLKSNVMQRGKDTALNLDQANKNNQWEVKRDELLESLDNNKKSLLDKNNIREQIFSNKNEREKNSDNEFYGAWKNSVGLITDKKMDETSVHDLKSDQFMPDLLPDDKDEQALLLQQARADCMHNKREVLFNMSIDQVVMWKDSFKEKVFTKHYPSLNRVFKNREEALKKIQRDSDDADKAILSAQQGVDHSQAILAAHGKQFIYQPKEGSKAFEQQLGLKGETSKLKSFGWPDEELPHDSTKLFSVNKQRFLVISDLGNMDRVRNDAKRLNAKIVCDEDSVNA
jgi:hypothetical protein